MKTKINFKPHRRPPGRARPLQPGARVVIANPAYAERGQAGTLEIEDGCWAVRFDDGTALGVGEDDVQAVEET